MAKIGILMAMQKERELFSAFLQNMIPVTLRQNTFYRGEYGSHQLTIVVSGMGKVNAALATATLIEKFDCEIIINIGISGGLDSSLNIGDIVVGQDIVYHDVWCGEPNAYGQIQGLPLIFHSAPELVALVKSYPKVLLCCGDKFISQNAELMNIKSIFPSAMAVDMESGAIAHTCYLYNTKLLVIRQISDTPGVEHHIEQYNNFWLNAPQNSITLVRQILELIK